MGIGNTLAGDDGAGIAAVTLLRWRLRRVAGLSFKALQGDLYEIADHLSCAQHFVFVDAFLSSCAGEVRGCDTQASIPQPSLHHSDIGTVMQQLCALKLVDPFPSWEVWGISVVAPLTLGEGLSADAGKGVHRLVAQLAAQYLPAA